MAPCVDAHAHLVGLDRDGHGCVVSIRTRRKLATWYIFRTIGARRDDPCRDGGR
jgi:hypothetical protein